MHKHWKLWCLATLVVVAIPSFQTALGQTKELSPEQLTERAEIVAVGRVASLRSEWSSDRKRITTQVTVVVSEYLKGGQQQTTMTIVVPGGEVDGVGETYSHVARFRTNEDVVVFAERDARGNLRVTGGEQGKYSITGDGPLGRKMVTEESSLEELQVRVQRAVQRQLKR